MSGRMKLARQTFATTVRRWRVRLARWSQAPRKANHRTKRWTDR